jgi:regulator of nucleoside diphosphate kinase
VATAEKDLEALAQELARAEIVDPREVRPDVVTMNSRVILQDIDTDEEMNYVLVFPKDADVSKGPYLFLRPSARRFWGILRGMS